jgi:hypothetical protein
MLSLFYQDDIALVAAAAVDNMYVTKFRTAQMYAFPNLLRRSNSTRFPIWPVAATVSSGPAAARGPLVSVANT